MKKIICILLIIVMSLNLSGCIEKPLLYAIEAYNKYMNDVSIYEQRRMLKHLEEKYGEEFVSAPYDSSVDSRYMTVYPKGREDEAFQVYLGTKPDRKKMVDDYVLREPQKKMVPIYEEWIQRVIPSAKVGVELSFSSYATEVFYDLDKSLQQFVDDSSGNIRCKISILLSEELLPDKDEIFEKLSNLPQAEPLSGFENTEYYIGFMKTAVFDNVKSAENISIPYGLSYYRPGDEDYAAVTYFCSKNLSTNKYHTKEDILEYFLYDRFDQQEDLRDAQNRMFPIYEEWIQNVLPTAKVAINLTLLVENSETFYRPDKSLQQFADDAKYVKSRVNIMLTEDHLANKDEIFEKLGTILNSEPISFYGGTLYKIAFLTKDAFDAIEPGVFIVFPDTYSSDLFQDENFIAGTYFNSKKPKNYNFSQKEIIQNLINKFSKREDAK